MPCRSHFKSSQHWDFWQPGTFQWELADRSGISQPTLSRVMPDVLGGVIGLVHLYINFPYTSAEERNYNMRHSQARAVVERTIGLFKGRWRCLDATGGKLLYKPEKVCHIVMACAVLHNVAQLRNVAIAPDADGHADPEPNPYPQAFEPIAAAVRQRVAVMRRL
ncbi:putative nuclease HARBI1 isoform X1 [Conger conger]|uniref:putative nuclease HARBI1 isoform X1 n=1 Tax=Conger conger TaxID=82655 RepID=UPI002A5A9BAA|nr:putative nuclease HARBI1 isoform X1 [Conger conger]